jgi:hypothetical protein
MCDPEGGSAAFRWDIFDRMQLLDHEFGQRP